VWWVFSSGHGDDDRIVVWRAEAEGMPCHELRAAIIRDGD
jgi:hypothetical protein